MEKPSNGILQHVTRKRREGEEIPFPDYYDEYIGHEPTGRIVKFLPDGKVEEMVIDNSEPKEEKIKSLVTELATLVGVETKQETIEIRSKLVTVIHECGTFEYIVDFDIDIDAYKEEINIKYWEGFVKDIQVTEIKLQN